MNHVDKVTGAPIPCDRDIKLTCIGIWFGSNTDFENLVQGHVRATLLRQLTSPVYLYQQIVVASSPVVWLFLDRVAYRLAVGDMSIAVSSSFDALAWWLLAIPSIIVLGVALAYQVCKKQACCVLDWIFSLGVLVVPACIMAAFVLIAAITRTAAFALTSAIFSGCTLYPFWKAKNRAFRTNAS